MKDKFKNTYQGCWKKFLNFLDDNSYIRNTLQFLHIRDTRDAKTEFRTVYANQIKPDDYEEKTELLQYSSNQVVTSKYTLWNFLPKNLFEQFRRIANIYFLINCIIIFVTPDPPTNPWTSVIPLLFVIIVTMIKQGYEDILRHKSDRRLNRLPVRIFLEGAFKDRQWHDIRCGDIVEVTANQPFPCDMLLLYSNTDDNKCFITTANLDGESNLKPRSVMSGLPTVTCEEDIKKIQAVVEYEKPNIRLYEFNGKLIIRNKAYPIVNENILLRGCNLRVAPVIYGLVLYTGQDTKIMRNSKFKSNKLSVIERRLNQFIIVFLLVLLLLTSLSFGLHFTSLSFYGEHWYLQGKEPKYFNTNYSLYLFVIFVHFMTLYNYIVPLSMYVTIELQRFVGSKFLQWDLLLYDEGTDQPCKANTSDLNEDLGQIEYLFSDKTGTLTENMMIFKQFSIDGVIYEEHNGKLYQQGSSQPVDIDSKPDIKLVIDNLSLCHTVQLDKDNVYQASSPDEFSFINFLVKLGIIYQGDRTIKSTKQIIRTVDHQTTTRTWEILEILEFDSTRKRMSVILRDQSTNKIVLYCKGAESFVIKKCVKGDVQQCLADIEKFAEQGWRTLALAYKEMTEADYMAAKELLNSAYNDILERNRRIAESFESIESDLTLIGSTAVEDKLQEDVAITLETLRKAGIKIWVLTGDKKETAINISNSCKHFSKNMEHLIITDLKTRGEIEARLKLFNKQLPRDKGDESRSFALTIDGHTLAILFNENFDEPFREICMRCDAVLCCRMSPAQKAQVVRLVKSAKEKPMTCSIGDGANDVSMIQEAHVGLGIFGKEGRNAALAADFAFAKFKFTKRILLAHGYLYYTRAANLVQYFFYKNLAFVICQFYYAFFTAFSVASLYDSIVLTMYNVIFTAAPILLFGLNEQKVPINKIEQNPYLYMSIKKNKLLSKREFLRWNLQAVWHSLVAFFFAYGIYYSNTPFSSDGKITGGVQFGGYIITLVVIIVHIKLLTEWQYKSYFLVLGYSLSLIGYIVFALLPNSFVLPELLTTFADTQTWSLWIYYNLFSHASVWLNMLLIIVTAIAPDIIWIVITNVRGEQKIRAAKQIEHVKSQQTVNNKLSYNSSSIHTSTTAPNNKKNKLPPLSHNQQATNHVNTQFISLSPHSKLYNRAPNAQQTDIDTNASSSGTPLPSIESPQPAVYEFTAPKRPRVKNRRVYQTTELNN